jgi:hypothetical protein
MVRLAGVEERGYVQSIIGATEKRRESGAGVAVIGDIGGSELGEAGEAGSLSGLAKGGLLQS